MNRPSEDNGPQPPHGRMAVLAVLGVALALVAYYLAFGKLTFSPKSFEFDLKSYYCGGEVALARADPYRVEPLRTCEDRVVSPTHAKSPLVLPAPQPAYVLAVMALFHGFPYIAVQGIVALCEIAAFLTTVALLGRLLPVSPWMLWATLGLGDLYASLYLGQLTAFCTLGIVLAGVGLVRASPFALAAGLVLAAFEPHVALPLFVAALAFGTARERSVTVATGLALVAVSFAFAPFAVLHEYAFDVLTSHAVSEASNQEQLSLTYALHAIGIAPPLAVTIAKLQYAAFVLVSLATLGPLARRHGRALIAFAPPAFALAGGPFVHITQFSAALPAALTLFAQRRSRTNAGALLFLAIPWIDARALVTVLPLVTACTAAIARYAVRVRPLVAWALALVATAGVAAAGFVALVERAPDTTSYGTIVPTDFAEVPWQRVVELKAHTHVVLANVEKLPTEIGLAIVLAGLLVSGLTNFRREHQANE